MWWALSAESERVMIIIQLIIFRVESHLYLAIVFCVCVSYSFARLICAIDVSKRNGIKELNRNLAR